MIKDIEWIVLLFLIDGWICDVSLLVMGIELFIFDSEDLELVILDEVDYLIDVRGELCDILEDEKEDEDDDEEDDDDKDDDDDDEKEDCLMIGWDLVFMFVESGGEMRLVWFFMDLRWFMFELVLEFEKFIVFFLREKLLCVCVMGFGVIGVVCFVWDKILLVNLDEDWNWFNRFVGLIFFFVFVILLVFLVMFWLVVFVFFLR